MSQDLRLPRGLPDEAYNLGEPTDEFALGAGRTVGKLVIGAICLLIGIGLLVLFVALIVGEVDRPAGGGYSGVGYLIVIAIALIVAGIAIPIHALRKTGLRVMACSRGLVYMHGEEVEIITWDDVEMLRYEVMQVGYNYGGAYPRYTVTRQSDGRDFTFDNFLPNLRALGRLLERKTLKHLLRDEREEYDDGKAVRFGPLAVSLKGIRKGDEWLRWDDVKDVNLDRNKGQIVISKEDKWLAWHRQLVNEVPNYHVFLELVRDEMSR